MAIDKSMVAHVARLVRLHLSDEELERMQVELSKILGHAERIQALDLDGVEPTSHSVPLSNVLRSDEAGECLPQSEVLAAAPRIEDGRFRVPRIIEDLG